MNFFNNKQFVGSNVDTYLPPLFKGDTFQYTPHWSTSKFSGLRRYVFRYEKDTFVYLATRMGQRSGGPSSTTSTFNIQFLVPSFFDEAYNFTLDTGNKYVQSSNNYIEYNAGTSSWEWYVRSPYDLPGTNPYTFALSAYSGTASSNLAIAGTINQVDWYLNYITPNIPATVTIVPQNAYNNNSISELNKSPIKNLNMEIPFNNGRNHPFYSGTPEGRPACITDDILFRCFEGIPLKPYDTVFIEIMWKYFKNKNEFPTWYGNENFPKNEYEWFVPAPVLMKRQKGIIYRIGKLQANTGEGGFDKVIFAQRTGVITWRGKIVGPVFDATDGGLSPIR